MERRTVAVTGGVAAKGFEDAFKGCRESIELLDDEDSPGLHARRNLEARQGACMIAPAIEKNAALRRRRHRGQAHAHGEIIAGPQFEPGIDFEREGAIEQFAVGEALEVVLGLRLNIERAGSGPRVRRRRFIVEHPRPCARRQLHCRGLVPADATQALDQGVVQFGLIGGLRARDPEQYANAQLPFVGTRALFLVGVKKDALPLDFEERLQFGQRHAHAAVVHKPVDHAQGLGRRELRLFARKGTLTRTPHHGPLGVQRADNPGRGRLKDSEVSDEAGIYIVH